MDQTPFPFVLEDNKTYNSKGAEEVWCITDQPGFVQKTLHRAADGFRDGSARITPLIIFKGKDFG